VLQRVAACCSVFLILEYHQRCGFQSFVVQPKDLGLVAVCCSVLQCVAVCYNVLQCVVMYCSGLQWVAVCCCV